MSRITFIFLLFIANLIRGPLSLVLIVFRNFVPALGKRIDFERKNLLEESGRSFKKDLLIADYCFEVSSEGELEQVRPLIEVFLKKQKKIEILFASPSVEKKCLNMALAHRDQIRIMRLPIASFAPFEFLFFQSPWAFVTAPVILFCRYDFYPELLSFKWLGKKLILLSASSKKSTWFKGEAFKCFNVIVASNHSEEAFFKALNPEVPVYSFDFRIPRIFDRIQKAPATLSNVPEIQSYLQFLKRWPLEQLIIFGSAWGSDLDLLNDPRFKADLMNKKLHLLIVPHSLSPESIQGQMQKLESFFPGVALHEIKAGRPLVDESILNNEPSIVVLNVSGVLCELYTLFKFAYVGGGFERSIHSVLEPYLSGARVFTGPKVHRSTEFDFILDCSPDEIHLLKNGESFYNLFKTYNERDVNQDVRSSLKQSSKAQMENIIHEIESC